MDSDLSAEIARIEAELAQDAELRQQQQQQQQAPQLQQQPPASLFGFGQAPQAQPQSPPQQQQLSNPFNVNASPFMPTPQQPDYLQQQQQQHQQQQQQNQQQQHIGGSGQTVAPNSAPTSITHSFSKDTDSRSIFIGNLPRGTDGTPTTTPEELVQFFADCGNILNCTVLKDRATGELKGTAYIEFADYTAMGKAIDTKNNANFKGSTIIVTHKRSNFKPGRGGRGTGRGRGRSGTEPLQALATFMTMLGAASGYRGRGGRGGGARGGGGVRGGGGRGGGLSGGASKPPSGSPSGGFQPYQ